MRATHRYTVHSSSALRPGTMTIAAQTATALMTHRSKALRIVPSKRIVIGAGLSVQFQYHALQHTLRPESQRRQRLDRLRVRGRRRGPGVGQPRYRRTGQESLG